MTDRKTFSLDAKTPVEGALNRLLIITTVPWSLQFKFCVANPSFSKEDDQYVVMMGQYFPHEISVRDFTKNPITADNAMIFHAMFSAIVEIGKHYLRLTGVGETIPELTESDIGFFTLSQLVLKSRDPATGEVRS